MESGSADGRELAQWRGQGRRPWPGRKRWRHPRSFGRACACRGTPAPTSFLSFFTSSGVLVVSGNARLGSQGWRGINLRILRWPIEMILLVGSPPLQGRSAMRGETRQGLGGGWPCDVSIVLRTMPSLNKFERIDDAPEWFRVWIRYLHFCWILSSNFNCTSGKDPHPFRPESRKGYL